MSQHDPAVTAEPARRSLSRRTVAKGAAWSAPLAIVSVGAPAYAASGSFTIFWDLVQYGGSENWWRLWFRFHSSLSQRVALKRCEVWTNYHDPATNGGVAQLVWTQAMTPITIGPGSSTLGTAYQMGKGWTVLPAKDGASLLPGYYNDFGPGDTDGTILCTTDYVYRGSASYPAAGERLVADGTYVLFYYDAGKGEESQRLEATTVGVKVSGGCVA